MGFDRGLDDFTQKLEALSTGGELDKIIDWTLNSLSHSVLKKIRAAPWPIKTKNSYNSWQFKKVNDKEYVLLNDATNYGVEYVPYIYRKGGSPRDTIVDGIVDKAIEDTLPEVEENFTERLQRYLK
jgi:hypothetical protein